MTDTYTVWWNLWLRSISYPLISTLAAFADTASSGIIMTFYFDVTRTKGLICIQHNVHIERYRWIYHPYTERIVAAIKTSDTKHTCTHPLKGPLTCKIFITFSESWCFTDNFDTKHSWIKCILYELH